jgi:hypothetical protein
MYQSGNGKLDRTVPVLFYRYARGDFKKDKTLSRVVEAIAREPLKRQTIHTFSLPAGWACPFAGKCLARADRETGKLRDGPNTEFRCFSASQEALYPSVRKQRWSNFERLRTCRTAEEMASLLLDELPAHAHLVRLDVSGDIFSQTFFDALLIVAKAKPDILLYGYTKSIAYWVARRDEMPDNFRLTASYGGRDDALIAKHGLRFARVVLYQDEAEEMGLEIDHDDTHCITRGPSFALLIHGPQPAKSGASRAVAHHRKHGYFGHGRRSELAVV